MNKITTTKKHLGFSLLEVMVALIVSSIALLGIAAGQLQSLKYASNSFDYTLALLEANNAVEQTWDDLCELQTDPDTNFNPDELKTQINKYTIEFENGFDNDEFLVSVSWTDLHIDPESEDGEGVTESVKIQASFPDISGGCQ